jgi:hypothetical protein
MVTTDPMVAYGGVVVFQLVEQESPIQAVEAEIRTALTRARDGDVEVLPRLRELLDHHPEIWSVYGDAAFHARAAWIDVIGGADLALKESLGRKAAAMRNELVGPSSSPLEGLLAERVVASWLQLAQAEATVAQATNSTMKQVAFAEKRLDAAHRRHLNAIGALATLQRLIPSTPALPALEAASPVVASQMEVVASQTPPGETANSTEAAGEVAEKQLGEVAESAAILAFVMPTPPRRCSHRPA